MSGHPSAADRSSEALATVQAQLSASEHAVGELRRALDAASERERWLSHELQHRVRNMLGVIRSIHRRSRESGASQDEFAEHFEGRLTAVARYHVATTGLGTETIDLEAMVRDELLGVQFTDGPRLFIAGPPVRLRQSAAELMGLAIHELTTNAIKFGALYHQGKLRVEWSLVDGPEQCMLHFRWREEGIPPLATAPRSNGFGQQLIEEALPYQLGAATSFELKPGGVDCSIELSLPKLDHTPQPEDDTLGDDLGDDAAPFLPSEQEEGHGRFG